MKSVQLKGESRTLSAEFPRCYRLTGTDEFSSVFSIRKALKSTSFLLHYCPQGDRQIRGTRLGVVIAKRFLRRAVDRNLLRRLIREVFRKQRFELPPYDVIFRLAAKPALPLDRRGIVVEIQALLDRLLTISRAKP